MIISASYKTDIPAFYGEWFRRRLADGYCRVVNPYNRNQHSKISLRREDVDGFIFWTKNVGPFMPVLREVKEQGFPFVVQYTINGYPRELESRVVDPARSVALVREVASQFSPKVVVWRYDTIVLSTLTDLEFHRRNFRRLASDLNGATDEVVVSFMQLYKKTERNMNNASVSHGFRWRDPSEVEKHDLLRDLQEAAAGNGMKLSVCTQPDLLTPGISEARCVDAERLAAVAGTRTIQADLKGLRPGCGCYRSKDIGDYDTCPHGCVYCYAVQDRALAAERFQRHDRNGEYLFLPATHPGEGTEVQGDLFSTPPR